MKSIYRIVNTIRNDIVSKKDRGSYVLQFVEYVESEGNDEPLEVIKNNVELKVGQIFRDVLNMSDGLDQKTFHTDADTSFDYLRYVTFIKEINAGLPKEALKFCFDVYTEVYETGRLKDAFVPTMNTSVELDCTDDGYLVEYYYFEDFENLLVFDFFTAIKERIAIKRCALCGTYFLTNNRTDEIYCSLDCRNVVSRKRSKIHHRLDDDNELLKRRVASRLQQRTKVSNEALREDRIETHKKFLAEVKVWKKKLKKGETTAEEYREWLEEQDRLYATMLERKPENQPKDYLEGLPDAGYRDVSYEIEHSFQREIEAEPGKEAGWESYDEENAGPEAEIDGAFDETAAWESDVKADEKPDRNLGIPLEEQGIPDSIKAKIMNFGGKKKSAVREAVFAYDDIGKAVEESGQKDVDFATFIQNTYGKKRDE